MLLARWSFPSLPAVPSPLHDTLNELFRDRPSLAVELIRELDDVDLPEGLPVQLGDNNLNDRPSKDGGLK
ncbi:hypothetical protein NOGI109294_09610 [Nocardiopsis gilva]